jgi:hypothetical protein
MIVVVTAEGLALALLALLVAGLLRSHAEILRALHQLGAPAGGEPHPTPVSLRPSATMTAGVMSGGVQSAGVMSPRVDATPVFDVAGVTPFDEAISIAVASPRVDTLLSFLSAGCATCARLWAGLADLDGLGLPDRTRVVVVTLGPGEESPAQVRRVAARGAPIVMSSEAWQDYRVPGAPYFIFVDGPGRVVRGEGSASSWAEVASLIGNAQGDGVFASSRAREARIDRELAAAGIQPGDPRLYHSPAVVPGPSA